MEIYLGKRGHIQGRMWAIWKMRHFWDKVRVYIEGSMLSILKIRDISGVLRLFLKGNLVRDGHRKVCGDDTSMVITR